MHPGQLAGEAEQVEDSWRKQQTGAGDRRGTTEGEGRRLLAGRIDLRKATLPPLAL